MNDQPDVKCPECGHDANLHVNGMGCAEHIGKDYGLGPKLCACPHGEKQVLRAALAEARAEIDAALAVVHAPDSTNDGGRASLAEEMQRLVDNNTDLNAEVERLQRERVSDGLLIQDQNARLEYHADDIAAERQRIAEWYAGAHCYFTANGQAPCLIVKHPDEWCSHCKDAYRIASGHFAQQQEVRDGE